MNDRLDPWLSALIRQERARPGPPPVLKTRVLERIHASLQSPPVPLQDRPTGEGGAVASWRTAAKVAGAATVALALVGAGALLASRIPLTRLSAQVAVAPRTAPSGVVAVDAPVSAQPPLAAAPPSVHRSGGDGLSAVGSAGPESPPSAPSVAASSSSRGLHAERELLDRARAHLLEGETAAALETIEVHRRRFPRGVLSEERDALQVEALGKAGRTREAYGAARAFHGAYPGSLLGRAVDDACGGDR